MAGFAGGALASAVTLSGGLGLISRLFDMDNLRLEFRIASEALRSKYQPQFASSSTLPIGVGFLPFVLKLEDALSVIIESKPAIVWLFAAEVLDDYGIWLDAIILQGADACGHGLEKGAGIVSLLPEASDALEIVGFGSIRLVAAGGIVDGRGVATALALGAQGVVMGTRFLATRETNVRPKYQAAALEAEDGGQVTTRSKLFDDLRGPNIWSEVYDGRSLIVKSFREWKEGMGIDEVKKEHSEAIQDEDRGFETGLEGRAAIWAGTGVGIVKEVENARDIVDSVRREAKEILGNLSIV
ncbi:NPD-domain-containing protein [Lojkania enalia]|uniref:NPD-domain-containing protein n=1 Tax=Lojkania enalia TaxID=147567 RepID=A0A9P4MVU0_9PLEO|nr:NPD-domain-containing protein [Didymosphaeria enalia]